MTTTTRDAFEAWIKKSLGYGNINTTVTGGYEWIAVAEAWEVWQAATAQGKRQPLTDEQIIDLAVQWPAETNDWASHFDFARAIEAAHEIKA